MFHSTGSLAPNRAVAVLALIHAVEVVENIRGGREHARSGKKRLDFFIEKIVQVVAKRRYLGANILRR